MKDIEQLKVKRWHCPVLSIDHTKWGQPDAAHTPIYENDNGDYVKYSDYEKLLTEIKERDALLQVANCPNATCTDGIMPYMGADGWEPEQCQWCYERNEIIEQLQDKK